MNDTEQTVYVHEFQGTRMKMTESKEEADRWARLGKNVWKVDLDECERYDDIDTDRSEEEP